MEVTPRTNTPVHPGNGGTDTTLNSAASSVHAAVDSIAGAADEAARKVKPAIDQVAAMAHQAVGNAAIAAEPAADWLVGQRDSLITRKKELVADTCDYVSANPLKSVGIAVVVGFLLSRIIR